MLRALRNTVVILPNDRTETVTEAGLVLEKSYNPELGLRRGKVISVGPKTFTVREGDEACYMAYSGVPAFVDDVRYLVMPEEDVVGITTEEV
jgi:co-chaperonin GroES (HSP10)